MGPELIFLHGLTNGYHMTDPQHDALEVPGDDVAKKTLLIGLLPRGGLVRF